jgi:ubiquinone/menaquinone biosynthesis C-methylase UbiE
MSRAGLALRALRLKVGGAVADPTPDYDIASSTYDDYFTRVMGAHSIGLLDEATVRKGDSVIELACGTGHLTAELARRLEGAGRLEVVDKSPGMLGVAQAKVIPTPTLDVRFTVGDMEEFMAGQPTSSADLVVIGWAICYSDPVKLLSEVKRVLRPGGQVAVIETRSDALSTLRHAFESVVTHDPSMLTALIRVALPRSERVLGRWFLKADLVPSTLRSGAQVLPCRTAADAVEWVERSGAGAGFRDSFDINREHEIRDLLRAALEQHRTRHGSLGLVHTFVVGVANRAASQAVAS